MKIDPGLTVAYFNKKGDETHRGIIRYIVSEVEPPKEEVRAIAAYFKDRSPEDEPIQTLWAAKNFLKTAIPNFGNVLVIQTVTPRVGWIVLAGHLLGNRVKVI